MDITEKSDGELQYFDVDQMQEMGLLDFINSVLIKHGFIIETTEDKFGTIIDEASSLIGYDLSNERIENIKAGAKRFLEKYPEK